MSIKLKIQYYNEDIKVIEVQRGEKISNIFPKIKGEKSFDKDKNYLMLNEMILENEKLISDYDLINEESILIMLNKENQSLEDYIDKCDKIINKNLSYKQILNNIKEKKFNSDQYNCFINNYDNRLTYKITLINGSIFFFSDRPFTVIINKIQVEEENKKEKEKIIKKIVKDNICCLEEIKDFFKIEESNDPYILNNNKEIYFSDQHDILQYIKNGILNIYYKMKDKYYNYSFEQQKLLINNNFKPKDLSEEFFNIFKYNNEKEEADTNFIYTQENERKNLVKLFNNLYDGYNLNIFKFAGPKGCGKSTTLLKYSRSNLYIMYINCRFCKELENKNERVKVFNYILKEFQRMNFDEPELKTLFQNLRGKSYTDILYKIIEYLEKKPLARVIILDQINNKYMDPDILKKYINFVKGKKTKIKLIICSSINNFDIEDEVLKTFENDISFKYGLDKNNQDFYFYCGYLYQNKNKYTNHILEPIFKLLGYKPKYIFLFSKSEDYNKSFTTIKTRINDDINDFLKGKKLFSISDILIFIKNNIRKEFKKIPYDFLKFIPLKYFSIQKVDDAFRLDYDFPYMEYIIDKLIKIEDCDNYFKNQRYNLVYLKGNVKGSYFEYSCIHHIKNSEFFGGKIKKYIRLESISKFDKVILDIEEYIIKVVQKKFLESKASKEKINDINQIDTKDIVSDNQRTKEVDSLEDNKSVKTDSNPLKHSTNSLDINAQFIEETNKPIFEFIKTKRKNLYNFNKDILKFSILTQKKKSEELLNLSKKITLEEFKEFIPNYLLDEIKPYFIGMEYYRKNNILNYQLPNYFQYKDQNIAFEQNNNQGQCLDYALLLGEQSNKIFLGIQIKCYSPDTSGGNLSDENKKSIKEKCKNIINGIKKMFNIEISEWHYLLIMYYNPKDKEGLQNDYLINLCQKNKLEYLFYNPEEKVFLNKNFEEQKKFEFNDLSNLDSFSFIFKNSDVYKDGSDEKIEMEDKLSKGYQQYFYDSINFFYEFQNINEYTGEEFSKKLENLTETVLNILNDKREKKLNYKFIFLKKIEYKNIPKIPNNFKMSAYVNKDDSNFICLLNINKKVFAVDCEQKETPKLLDSINRFNREKLYFYFFDIIKVKK